MSATTRCLAECVFIKPLACRVLASLVRAITGAASLSLRTTTRDSGRADYFGEMPNLAARVAGLAHPGQILVEGTSGFTSRTSSSSHAPSPGPGAALGGVGDRSFNSHAPASARPLFCVPNGCICMASVLPPPLSCMCTAAVPPPIRLHLHGRVIRLPCG